MIEVSIKKEDIDRINKLLSVLDGKKQDGAIYKGFQKASSSVLRQLIVNVSGNVLHRRTGNLAKSMGYRVYPSGDQTPEAVIGSGASLQTNRILYANILETGGVINPVTAKMLAIPIGKALTPSKVARFKPREITTQGGYDKSFIRRSKAGNLILFGAIGNKVTPLFVLKDQVRIPAFRYMGVTVDQVQGQVVNDIVDKIREAKEKA